MVRNNAYLFKDITELAQHLLSLNKDLTPLRLQKSLYFLFAFYGASYGQLYVSSEEPEENVFEGTDEESYPKYLFPDKFEAWKFGPVNRDLYKKFKNKELIPKKWNPKTEREENINVLFQQVLEEVDSMGDFELVDRTHDDRAWKDARTEMGDRPKEMDQEKIIEDYITYV